jgi:hypothetical protein
MSTIERRRVIHELTETEERIRDTEQALKHDRAARERLDARLNATLQEIWGSVSPPSATTVTEATVPA